MNKTDEGVVILDARGVMLHALYGTKDDDAFPVQVQLASGEMATQFENTANAGFGAFLTRYLLPIIEVIAPRRIIAVWDGGSDYRKGLFPGYKARRSARRGDKPQEVIDRDKALEDYCKTFMASIGVTQCQVPGVEADDLIALLCQRLSGHKLVYTVDADLLQLNGPGCTVMLKGEAQEGDGYMVHKDLAKPVPFHLISLCKSLLGDTSDEYPGVKGFGPAKWNDMVEEYGFDGMEELEQCVKAFDYKVIADILAGAQRNKSGKPVNKGEYALEIIYENRNDWALMYAIASLRPDLCEHVHNGVLHEIKWYKRVLNKDRALKIMEDTGTIDLYPMIRGILPTQELVTCENYEEALRHYKEHLDESPYVAFDFESYDTLEHAPFQEASNGKGFVDVLSQSITGASFTYGRNLNHTIYISVDHKDTANLTDEHIRWAIEAAEAKCELLVQNASFETALCDTNLRHPLKTPYDTMIMASYVNENESSHLKDMSLMYLRYKQATYKETLEKAGAKNMRELTGEQVLSYGCDDAAVTASLFDLFKLILEIEGTWEFVRDQEFPTVHPLYRGFEAGVRIDFDRLSELEKEDAEIIEGGMKGLRDFLRQNCSSENIEGATALYEDLAAFERAKLKDEGKNEGAVESKLLALKESILADSKYMDVVQQRKAVSFAPTALQISKVAETLGFSKSLEGVSANKVTEWVAEISDWLQDGHLELADDGAELVKFTGLLAAAVPQLRKREGAEYDAFAAFCTEVLTRNAPIETFGTELNFDSPKQMQSLFYAMLGLPIRVRSKVQRGSVREKLDFPGSPATDDKAVEMAIAEDAPEGSSLREFLETYRKVKGALTRGKIYYKPYPLWQHPSDGMVHGSIKNCGTVTRRPSGSSPNFLQVAKRGDGKKIRTAFLPRYDDHVIISADFSGQELRIMASESQCPVLLDAYIGPVKKDIHSVTAAGIAPVLLERKWPAVAKLFTFTDSGIPYDDYIAGRKSDDKEVSGALNDVRNLFAKAVNFLIIYGGGPHTLARNLGIPVEMAQAIMDQVFRTYPGIRPWQERTIEFARKHGYVVDAWGNRRHAPADILSRDGNKRSRAERQLVNAPIQGGAASMLKVCLTKMHHSHLFEETRSILIAPIYDEVTSSVPRDTAVEYSHRLIEIMEMTPPGHAIPMEAELSIGANNWGEQIELGFHPSAEAIEAALRGETLKEAA